MPSMPERTPLYRLYTTERSQGLPSAIDELYPERLDARRYLGTAGSCRNGGAGIFYRPCDWESDNCVALERVARWGTPQTPVPTALYRLYDQNGTLLYIGITYDPDARWSQHEIDKPWWPRVADQSLEWLPSRDRALEAEARAIRAEHPLHNTQHNTRAIRTPQKDPMTHPGGEVDAARRAAGRPVPKRGSQP